MEIEFIATQPQQQLLPPQPAVKGFPEWYKKLSAFWDGSKQPRHYEEGTANITVKWCNPFGDALGAGYQIVLGNDLQVTQEDNNTQFRWNYGGENFVSTHDLLQVSPDLIPPGFNTNPFKFRNLWGIKTPKGYSSMIVHPLNRPELPFYTLAGVVETDTYVAPIHLPFLIRKDFLGIIPAGTPIAQVIPFQRKSWVTKITDFNAEKAETFKANYHRTMHRPYKRLHWQRKEWK